MTDTKVVIFAGGAGTRLSELTGEVPKPMVEIGGTPIVVHIMRHFYAAGYRDFILAVGYMSEQFKRWFMEHPYRGRDMVFTSRGQEVLGPENEDWSVSIVETGLDASTAQRLHRVKEYLNDAPFFLTYGDCVSNVDLEEIYKKHRLNDDLITITAVPKDERYGLLKVDGQGGVKEFSEKTSQKEELINGGFMLCSPEVLEWVDDNSGDFSHETLTRIAAAGRMGYHLHDGFWRPCDTKRDFDLLNKLWSESPELFGE